MSIIIKGMSMPKNGCFYCCFREGGNCSLLENVPYGEIIRCSRAGVRHEQCPLHEYEPKEDTE